MRINGMNELCHIPYMYSMHADTCSEENGLNLAEFIFLEGSNELTYLYQESLVWDINLL